MDDIDITVIDLPRDIRNFHLVAAFFEYRKKIFVDRMAWPLHNAEGIEFEQYDSFNDTVYVVAHRGAEVIGGARLKRTDAISCSGRVRYSYMIRDAHLGLLEGMPGDLCHEEPPVDDRCWELTRLASEPVLGLSERILDTANDYLFRIGARECLFLGPPAFMRMATKLGWTPKALGEIVGNKDGRFLAFACPVRPPAGRMLHA